MTDGEGDAHHFISSVTEAGAGEKLGSLLDETGNVLVDRIIAELELSRRRLVGVCRPVRVDILARYKVPWKIFHAFVSVAGHVDLRT